ncbi:hypothetical protein D3C76_1129390 [compost metagenome]
MHHRKLHALAFDQNAVALAADGPKVHENVITRVSGDKTKAFRCVEPFDGAGITVAGILCHVLTAACLARAAGKAHGQMQGHGQRRTHQGCQVAHFRAGQ